MIKAVLLDLDGTLIDTAADMGAALNNLLIEENLKPLPPNMIRPYVSQGGLVLTRLGFGHIRNEAEIEALRQRYLHHYHAIIADESKLFEGFDSILKQLETRGMPWGVVTNKPMWLTQPLLEHLGLAHRASVVIAGDTLEKRKPDPLPLRVAAERIGMQCRDCVYVGDDERDIQAGNAADMKTLVAAYGYIAPSADILSWKADGVIEQAVDLLSHPLFLCQE